MSVSMLMMAGGFAAGAWAASAPIDHDVYAVQQTSVCKGVVRDINGEALIGATVTVKGSKTQGTITDDSRYGWMNGTMNWKIPVGWNERNSANGETVVKSFQTYWQQFSINAQGTLRIAKLGNWIQRGTNNIVQINGGVR